MAKQSQSMSTTRIETPMHKIDPTTLHQLIEKEIALSRQLKQAARLHYYQTINYDSRAIISWEQFVGTWTYTHWIELHKSAIDAFIDQQNQQHNQVWTY